MAKIKANLEASFGYYYSGGKKSIDVEVSDEVLAKLRNLSDGEITCEQVVAAIEGGESVLQTLHEELAEAFYYMVEEYYLYEGDNDCMEESLAEYIEQDIADGLYMPKISKRKRRNDEECEYDLNAYYDWVCNDNHDHAFIAERVGLNLDACREDEVNYTIQL